MGVLSKGARIELQGVGSLSESYAIGQYWAKKLAHGAKLRGISLKPVRNGWKIIIRYHPKESAR